MLGDLHEACCSPDPIGDELAGLTTTFASSYTAQVSLPGALQMNNITAYAQQATRTKYLIRPDQEA